MDWEPYRADHSIDRVISLLSFSAELNVDQFDSLVVVARKAATAAGLTDRVEFVEPVQLSTSDGGPRVINVDLSSGGASLPRRVVSRRLDASDKPADEFSVSRKQIGFTTHRYRRWADYIKEFKDILSEIQVELHRSDNIEFNVVKLQYIDRFLSTTPRSDHFQVISNESPFIPGVLRSVTENFHSHTGWFDLDEAGARYLNNINVDIVDTMDAKTGTTRRRVSILTLRQTPQDGSVISRNPVDDLGRLHSALKDTYRMLITKEAADRVALDK